MTTVTLKEPANTAATPALPETVIDSLGRTLKIRELSILEESRIIRECGEAASNAPYMYGYVFPAALISEIDGINHSAPTTARQIEAAIQNARREGLAAVMAHIEQKAKEGAGGNETDIKA